MWESIRKMWKIPELRNKILYTLGMLVLFRLVGVIPAPGVDAARVLTGTATDLPILQLVNMMTGSNFANMTIMAMGITPYINASIIMQLLTIAIPALERMQRDEEGGGREKIARITRYVTVGLAAVQAIGLVAGLGYIKSGWFNYVLVGIESINVVGAAIGTLCCFAVVAIMDLFVIHRIIPAPPRMDRIFVKPLIASGFMALAAWACHGLLAKVLGLLSPFQATDAAGVVTGLTGMGNAIATLGGIGIGVVVYVVLIVALKAISKDDLSLMPKGDKLAKILRIS